MTKCHVERGAGGGSDLHVHMLSPVGESVVRIVIFVRKRRFSSVFSGRSRTTADDLLEKDTVTISVWRRLAQLRRLVRRGAARGEPIFARRLT